MLEERGDTGRSGPPDGAELARALRQLRRRDARVHDRPELTYRQLAAATGWAHGVIGDYFTGATVPPTNRLDELVRILGATASEQGRLATLRDAAVEMRRTERVTAVPVPRQLPFDPAGLVGRDGPLTALDQLLEPTLVRRAARIAVLCGPAGVGKTALAVHWAHRAAGHFPDGQLYVDLLGYSDLAPVPAASALSAFLRALGALGDLSEGTAERAARYRSALAERRMLILLDNVSSAEQVRPLLPGGESCVVLVTSRDALGGLVAREGSRRVPVEPLSGPDAVELLSCLIGDRATIEPAATRALAERCSRLPLALQVAAELAALRPTATVPELVAELDDERHRLDLLSTGADPVTSVRAVLSWSMASLSSPAATAFGLLGLHPVARFGAGAALALSDTFAPAGRAVLDELVRAHLIESSAGDRFGLHDLLRAYSVELAARLDRDTREDALVRLAEHYAAVAGQADRAAFGSPGAAPPAAALAWFETESDALVAVARTVAEFGRLDLAGGIAGSLRAFLASAGRHRQALVVNEMALRAAVAAGDPAAESAAATQLGKAYGRLGDAAAAEDRHRHALRLRQRSGDTAGQVKSLNNLGIGAYRLGRYPQALDYYDRALSIARAAADPAREAQTLINLGLTYWRLGRYPEALAHHQVALEIFRSLGDRHGEAVSLGNIGDVLERLGQLDEALAHHRQDLAIVRELGLRPAEGESLYNLGAVRLAMRDTESAREHFEEALAIARTTGDASLEISTLNALGETDHQCGMPAALGRHREAAVLARTVGEEHEHARALRGIARALHAVGDATAAATWREATGIYSRLGAPEQADPAPAGMS